MHCKDKKIIGVAGLVLALALCLPQMLQGAEADGGPDGAMRAFLSALKSKDTTGVLAAFSQTTPWQMVNYDIGNPRRIIDRKTITYGQLARDFHVRKGWFEDFIEYTGDGHTMGDTIRGMPKWYKNGNTFSNGYEKGKLAKFYIKWRPEGRRWFIAEIGNSPS